MSISAEVDADAADAMLGRVLDAFDDPTPLLRYLGESIAEYEMDLFRGQGKGQWAPLDPATVKAKGSNRLLVDTGELLYGLTRSHGGNTRISGDTVTLHSSEVSAVMLQRGARGMPKRNPTPKPPPATVRAWAEDLLGAVTTGGLR